jgi:hypothetical protein
VLACSSFLFKRNLLNPVLIVNFVLVGSLGVNLSLILQILKSCYLQFWYIFFQI